MDPIANVREQRELAEQMVALLDADPSPADLNEQLTGMADRLAELVLALDRWRRNGGFDPYAGGQT